ncbi:SAM-dependent methyltransferase [Rhodobacterales bacterium HKCCE3408]|nr:SAM-dependent methyltransferase [Rhodobacterales bacterium HKCCE3408]
MTEARPQLVDPEALARHRRRARPEAARFLHDAARDELDERLIDVNRSFTTPALVTPFPDLWDDFLPDAPRVAPDETLALEPGAHDLVVHAMALHWSEDPLGQIIQCTRALQPDGLFLAVCLGGTTLTELRASLAQAEAELTGGISPRVAPMAEIRDLGALLQRAGLALPVADSLALTATYSGLPALARDLRAMGETNALAARLRHPTPKTLFARAGAHYAQSFPAEENRIRTTFELVFLTGWRPHESQPKPLRPGSAAHRLADALGVTEFDETGADAQKATDEVDQR